ncbi:MAG TPA: hypothetical protein VJZ92_05185 [Thermodesulfobacteriota bacterium]|nr:hypothetical protein [Thermodesulfobacteriota bacterium]
MFYEEIFEKLNDSGIDYIVVGGVALVLHGVVRLTAVSGRPQDIADIAALKEIEKGEKNG